MRPLQRFLLCLLCAVLPLRGGAGVLGVPTPCPMQLSQAMAPASAAASAAVDCCEHGDQSGGKPCKTGQDCPCGGQVLLMSGTAASQRPRSVPQVLPTLLPVAAFHPSAVWRPPTLL
jgi:hypothetical protein